MSSQEVRGENAVGLQIDGDYNTVTVFVGASRLRLDQPHKRRGRRAPANERELLLTEWRATTLVGRGDELTRLATWRDCPDAIAIRCITGRAGSGKTRLAIEACEAAEAAQWIAGFVSGDELRRFSADDHHSLWRSSKDTLIVIDDAAASVSILKEWFAVIARRPECQDAGKLRILLLERHADADSEYGWWAELKRPDNRDVRGAGDLIGAERPYPLAIIAEAEQRRDLLSEAMQLAAGILGKPALDPPRQGAHPDFDRRLSDSRIENEPLFLLMAGLVAVEKGAPAALALGRTQLAQDVAALERKRLERLSAAWGVHDHGDLIAHLAACATLQRGCGFVEADRLVREEIEAMGYEVALSPEPLINLLAEALPSPGEGIDRVRPDLIGEAFLVREISGSRVRTPQTRQAIIRRAYGRQEAKVLETLVLTAQDLAAGAADHPVVRWLMVLTDEVLHLDQLMRIADGIPESTLALRELGAVVEDRIVKSAREAGNAELLALALNRLSIRLGDLGRREAALDAAQEAVELYRSLVLKNAGGFKVNLASSVNNLTKRLSDLGRREAALTAAQEAVELYRGLATEQREAFSERLAAAFNNLSICLSNLGKREAALNAAQEAVDLYRALAADRPEIFRHDLAMSLTNLGSRLNDLNRDQSAVVASREAVDLYRSLAAERPDAFNQDLAGSLNNLAVCLARLDRGEAALAAAEESVDVYRGLALNRPNAFNHDLAMSINTLANRLSELGRCEPALAAAQEAVDLYRSLAAERADAFGPLLANALSVLGDMLEDNGNLKGAVEHDREAVETLASYFFMLPPAFERKMLAYLSDYARRAEAADIELDHTLLIPIVTKLQELQQGENDAG